MIIQTIDLNITYDFEGDLLELSNTTSEDIPFELHIIDKDKEVKTGRTTIQFNDINELRKALDDFDKRFNSIKNHEIYSNRTKR